MKHYCRAGVTQTIVKGIVNGLREHGFETGGASRPYPIK